MLRLILFVTFLLGINFYAFQALKTMLQGSSHEAYRRWIYLAYWLFCLVVLCALAWVMIQGSKGRDPKYQPAFALLILMLVPQLIVITVLLGEDLYRLVKGLVMYVYDWLGKKQVSGPYVESRRIFISRLAAGAAAIPFAGILHGVTVGKYNFKVRKQVLHFPDLPEAFDGFTITQLSDIHSGSFDDKKKVEFGVEMANQQGSDVILFTGDLVNNKAEEMEPWKEVFAGLKAPMGKFSVLGNHDYGDYVPWPSPEAKKANLQRLAETHAEMGFQLLRNQNVCLERDGQSICIAGVENWGLPPFPQYGKLDKALEGASPFKILMSHDPSHWDAEVKHWEEPIHLTLSGHTHGMQFGIEIPGFKWSPVSFRYPKWAGLYTENNRHLYVNRGFGYLAFPGRVGIWPEITVIELRKA